MTEFKKFKVSKFFDIQKVRGINKSGLTKPTREHTYDYITRTSKNNGIEEITGLVANRELNEPETYSLGLLQMTFFLRDRPWYGGQFVRKIVPKFELNRDQMLYFLGVLQALSPMLKDILVRNIDKTFLNTDIELPVTPSGDPDFAYMTHYIQDLEAQRIQDLDAYLKVSGLDNTTLTDQEKATLTKKVEWKKFRIDDVFDINNTASILKSQIISNSGNTPYVTASGQNNGVQTYISSGNLPLEKGPCLMIGGKTFIVTYQSADFVSNDSHNLVLRLKDQSYATEKVYLYLISVIKAYGQERFTWNDAVTKKRLRKGQIVLPVVSTGSIDFAYMQDYITALEKLNIKDVVAYKDKVITATKQIVSQQS